MQRKKCSPLLFPSPAPPLAWMRVIVSPRGETRRVLKPRSRRSRLGIKQKLKIPTGNTFGIEDFPSVSLATWLRLKRTRQSFRAQPRVQRLAWKGDFFFSPVSRFWKLFIYFFLNLRPVTILKGPQSHEGREKKAYAQQEAGGGKYLASTFFFSNLKTNFGFATDGKEATVLARSANLNVYLANVSFVFSEKSHQI